jgi:hypothetical protein
MCAAKVDHLLISWQWPKMIRYNGKATDNINNNMEKCSNSPLMNYDIFFIKYFFLFVSDIYMYKFIYFFVFLSVLIGYDITILLNNGCMSIQRQ